MAATYTKTLAKQIGLERGFQLHRYAQATKRNARQLWTRNVPLGKDKTPVRKLSAAKIAALAQGASLQEAKRNKPQPTRAMKASKRTYQSSLPYETEVRIDVEKEEVLVRIALEDFLEHY